MDTGAKPETQKGALIITVEIHSSEDLCAFEEQPKGVGDG